MYLRFKKYYRKEQKDFKRQKFRASAASHSNNKTHDWHEEVELGSAGREKWGLNVIKIHSEVCKRLIEILYY